MYSFISQHTRFPLASMLKSHFLVLSDIEAQLPTSTVTTALSCGMATASHYDLAFWKPTAISSSEPKMAGLLARRPQSVLSAA